MPTMPTMPMTTTMDKLHIRDARAMRAMLVRRGVVSMIAAMLSGWAGCTSDTTPIVYIGMAYQVRCLDCQPRVPDDPERDVRVVDGEAGFNLDCSVTKSDGARRVTFSAEHTSETASRNYLLSVKNARLGGDESDGPCQLRLVEGDNTYVAACSTDEPSDERPCQITLEEKDDVIRGGIYCARIPNDVSLASIRYVVAPNERTEPAKLELYGCRGL